MADQQQLRLDLEELQYLKSLAKRPRVIAIISSDILVLNDMLLDALAVVTATATAVGNAFSVAPVANYVMPPAVESSSWNQDSGKVKLLDALAVAPMISTGNASSAAPVTNYMMPLESSSWNQDSGDVKLLDALIVAPMAAIGNASSATPMRNYAMQTLESFSWDQDDDEIMIHVPLLSVDQEKLEAVFKTMSFDVKFYDVQGKDYHCAIPQLNKKIVPENCTVVAKPSEVIITLYKASKGNWMDLQFNEEKDIMSWSGLTGSQSHTKYCSTSSDNGKIVIHFDERGQPLGKEGTQFLTFLSEIARVHMPVYMSWHDVPQEVSRIAWRVITDAYVVPEVLKDAIFNTLNKCIRDKKIKLMGLYDALPVAGERIMHSTPRRMQKIGRNLLPM